MKNLHDSGKGIERERETIRKKANQGIIFLLLKYYFVNITNIIIFSKFL